MKTTLWKQKIVLTFLGILTLSFMASTMAHADDDDTPQGSKAPGS